MTLLSADEVRALVRQMIADRYESQKQAAQTWGIAPQVLNDALQGRRAMPATVLARLGLRPVVMYLKGEPT